MPVTTDGITAFTAGQPLPFASVAVNCALVGQAALVVETTGVLPAIDVIVFGSKTGRLRRSTANHEGYRTGDQRGSAKRSSGQRKAEGHGATSFLIQNAWHTNPTERDKRQKYAC